MDLKRDLRVANDFEPLEKIKIKTWTRRGVRGLPPIRNPSNYFSKTKYINAKRGFGIPVAKERFPVNL